MSQPITRPQRMQPINFRIRLASILATGALVAALDAASRTSLRAR